MNIKDSTFERAGQFILLVGTGAGAYTVGPFATRLEAYAAVKRCTPPSGCTVRMLPLQPPTA